MLQVLVTGTVSAVNYISMTGGATGSGPIISVAGTDSNSNELLTAKGKSEF